MNTPTPAQALGGVLDLLATHTGGVTLTIEKLDDGRAVVIGPAKYLGAVIAAGNFLNEHGQHFAALEKDLSVARQSLYEVAEQRNSALARAREAEGLLRIVAGDSGAAQFLGAAVMDSIAAFAAKG